MPIHRCNKEKEIAEIQADIKYIKESIKSIEHKLVGNGSPGLVDEMNQLKGGLNTFKWLYGAALGLLGAILALIGSGIL